mmetsp:Transcript_139208/g.277550  ORF Transcript_139208/g.277550 Transcript_139208/m.277550 type:complete len:544 (+) Transcript_139208:61-1692(+)
MRGVVLWCDSDVSVAKSANLFRAAGLEVRCMHEPEEVLAEYSLRGKDVVAIVSSMMESGGRKERRAMNALGLFAACREVCYSIEAMPPIYAIISSSADRATCFAGGADAVLIGKRKRLQELVMEKLQARCTVADGCSMTVLWCDSSDPSSKVDAFQWTGAVDVSVSTFKGVEEMVAVAEGMLSRGERIGAVISSMMESGGRKEQGLMNAFDSFSKIRALAESSSCRPSYAIISGSATMDTCYAHGADIAITKDNAVRKERHPTGSMWDHLVKDVVAQLSALLPSNDHVADAFPEYWKNQGDDTFSEMVTIHDAALNDALQAALRDTFKRGDDGTAHSTRDRPPGERPKDFRLVQAYRIEDYHLWRKYSAFRARVGPCDDFELCAGPGGSPKTSLVDGLPHLTTSVNETYLFHGTSPEAANGIIHTGFRIDLAGTAAGCAFGKGAYLAEASTKSDEYARSGDGIFGRMYAMLLCRTVLGRTVRVEDFYHSDDDVRDLVDGIIANGTHDCVLGDRESKVGTYREFIVFKREQIYPEFVLLYHRDC